MVISKQTENCLTNKRGIKHWILITILCELWYQKCYHRLFFLYGTVKKHCFFFSAYEKIVPVFRCNPLESKIPCQTSSQFYSSKAKKKENHQLQRDPNPNFSRSATREELGIFHPKPENFQSSIRPKHEMKKK